MLKSASAGGRVSIWVPIAFASTGFLIGFTTGLSNSPVVKVLLPLIFGLIAGGAGFFATIRLEQSKMVGISLTALTFMAFIGIVQGIVIRDDSSWHSFWIHRPANSVQMGEVNAKNLQKYVTLLALRSRLQKAGFSAAEQTLVLNVATQSDDLNLVNGISQTISILDEKENSFKLLSPNALANQEPNVDEIRRTQEGTGF